MVLKGKGKRTHVFLSSYYVQNSMLGPNGSGDRNGTESLKEKILVWKATAASLSGSLWVLLEHLKPGAILNKSSGI
jgi:hypothetical protein